MQDAPDSSVTKSSIINILVVDDDPLVLDTICFLVTSMGYQAHAAKDGSEAIDLFEARSASIPLVVMDVEMPRLGGVEASQIIRKMEPSTKIILCSGNTRQDVWQADPDAFLLKPFMFNELRAVIQKLLPSRGGEVLPLLPGD